MKEVNFPIHKLIDFMHTYFIDMKDDNDVMNVTLVDSQHSSAFKNSYLKHKGECKS